MTICCRTETLWGVDAGGSATSTSASETVGASTRTSRRRSSIPHGRRDRPPQSQPEELYPQIFSDAQMARRRTCRSLRPGSAERLDYTSDLATMDGGLRQHR